MSEPMSRTSPQRLPGAGGVLVVGLWLTLSFSALGDAPMTKASAVDATTLRHKVLCGYQGWFRCPGDPADEGWKHWSRSRSRITPETVTFEMWPDLTEYGDDERYPAPGFTYPDGK